MNTHPYNCGICGATFASRGDKRRHKMTCNKVTSQTLSDEPCPDEYQYGRIKISPAIKRRAAAEWEAMDWRGRLPKGWTYEEQPQ